MLIQGRLNKLSSRQKMAQQEAISDYIDQLVTKLKDNKLDDDAWCNNMEHLGNLLKEMTKADPTERLSTKDALNRYNLIFPENNVD